MRWFSVRAARIALLPAVALLAALTMGSSDTVARYNELGHKMMCICSCNQILIECNHLGCPDSDRMLGELRSALSHGDSDNTILTAFQDKYGPTVLAAPMLTKFNIVAWVVPPVLLLIGIVGTIALVRKWRLRTVATPAPAQISGFEGIRDQIRKDTEL